MVGIGEKQPTDGESQSSPFKQLEDLLRKGERIDNDTGHDQTIETGDNVVPDESDITEG